MKKRTAWVVAAGVAALALGAAAVGLVALALRGGRPALALSPGAAHYLRLEVEGSLADEPAGGLAGILESRPPSLRGLIEAVDRAGRDAKVKGLLLRVGPLDAGWGRVGELREALVRFRKSGKPSWAHLELVGNREYYLATGCQKIAASPSALLDVSGLAAEVTFYKGTLDKLGVEAQFEGIGKYKNAPNQFTETGFTAPHREQMEALVGSLFETYVSGLAEGRGLKPEQVTALVEDGPYDASRAKAAGLVDELLYRDEVESRVGASGSLSARGYLKAARGFSFGSRPQVALVHALGTIMPGESVSNTLVGDVAGADTIIRGLREAAQSDSVRAVVLRVDSPGGSGTAADAIWRETALLRKTKPVVVSMGDYAASGGYYIAMNADAIVAQPGTITGSIGVFSGKFSLRGLYQKLGLTEEVVQRGRNARLFSSSQPWDAEERARVRELNRAFYSTFVAKAAEGRQRTEAQIEAVAQGRVWTGLESLEAGLVDRLGDLSAAIALAREKAGIAQGQEVELLVVPEPKGFFELLLERQEEDVAVRLLGVNARGLALLRGLAEAGPIARIPFELSVR